MCFIHYVSLLLLIRHVSQQIQEQFLSMGLFSYTVQDRPHSTVQTLLYLSELPSWEDTAAVAEIGCIADKMCVHVHISG